MDVNEAVVAAVSDAKLDDKSDVVLVNDPACAANTGIEISQVPPIAKVPPTRLIAVVPLAAVKVPPQVLVAAGVAAISKPVGNVLVNPIPVTAIAPPLLSMLKSRVEVSPWFNDGGVNVCVKTKGTSVDVSDTAGAVAVAMFDVMLNEGLVNEPASVERSVTMMSHVDAAANVPPDKLITPDSATAVTVPQVLDRPLGVSTTKPVGKVSVKAIEDSSIALAVLSTLIVATVDSPCKTVAGVNVLTKPGAVAGVTVRPTAATVAVSANDVTSKLGLVSVPASIARTSKVTIQLPPTAMSDSAATSEPVPGAPVSVDVQVADADDGSAITRPAGKTSVNDTEGSAIKFALLSIVMVMVLFSP